ncbi:MAG: DUF2336 domain-containing protein [Alphaproteobacteria bacterium]
MATAAKQYQELGGILQSDDDAARKALAADPTTPPEVLYFFAENGEAPRYRAKRLFDENKLTNESLAAALDNKDYEFVKAALALRAKIPMPTVERMVRVKSVKTIVALAWKAGLSARFAIDLQRDLAFIAPNKIMNARDGIDFPMRVDDMESQLSIFE